MSWNSATGTLLQRRSSGFGGWSLRQMTLGDRSRQSSQKSVMIFHTQGVRWILCEPHRVIEEDDATNETPCASASQTSRHG
jgi:hypothetical protein